MIKPLFYIYILLGLHIRTGIPKVDCNHAFNFMFLHRMCMLQLATMANVFMALLSQINQHSRYIVALQMAYMNKTIQESVWEYSQHRLLFRIEHIANWQTKCTFYKQLLRCYSQLKKILALKPYDSMMNHNNNNCDLLSEMKTSTVFISDFGYSMVYEMCYSKDTEVSNSWN